MERPVLMFITICKQIKEKYKSDYNTEHFIIGRIRAAICVHTSGGSCL